jgi:hypothetical protein
MRRIFQNMVLFWLVLMVAGCSVFQTKSSTDNLRQRVDGYMTAKINGNWAEVYDYLTPEYRQETTKEAFASMSRGMDFLSYTIDSIEIEPSGTEAVVSVKQDFKAQIFSIKDDIHRQHWIYEKNQWYVKMGSSSPFGPFKK